VDEFGADHSLKRERLSNIYPDRKLTSLSQPTLYLSATAPTNGKSLGTIFVLSTYSDHIQASPADRSVKCDYKWVWFIFLTKALNYLPRFVLPVQVLLPIRIIPFMFSLRKSWYENNRTKTYNLATWELDLVHNIASMTGHNLCNLSTKVRRATPNVLCLGHST
jgi:hypothetical protein